MTLPDRRFIDNRDIRNYFDYYSYYEFFTAYNATMVNMNEDPEKEWFIILFFTYDHKTTSPATFSLFTPKQI